MVRATTRRVRSGSAQKEVRMRGTYGNLFLGDDDRDAGATDGEGSVSGPGDGLEGIFCPGGAVKSHQRVDLVQDAHARRLTDLVESPFWTEDGEGAVERGSRHCGSEGQRSVTGRGGTSARSAAEGGTGPASRGELQPDHCRALCSARCSVQWPQSAARGSPASVVISGLETASR